MSCCAQLALSSQSSTPKGGSGTLENPDPKHYMPSCFFYLDLHRKLPQM